MDESLRSLEERLEQLVPRGLGDHGRERLEEEIDRLAEETVRVQGRRRRWPWALGAAAAIGLVCGLAFLSERPDGGSAVVHASSESGAMAPVVYETLGYSQKVDDRFDGGTILGNGTEAPYRYWGYSLTETEEVLHLESGYKVHISSEREEGILTRVTSF